MPASASPIPAQLVTDLTTALTRLRMARTMGDVDTELVAERRLNWLLDHRIPRTKGHANASVR